MAQRYERLFVPGPSCDLCESHEPHTHVFVPEGFFPPSEDYRPHPVTWYILVGEQEHGATG